MSAPHMQNSSRNSNSRHTTNTTLSSSRLGNGRFTVDSGGGINQYDPATTSQVVVTTQDTNHQPNNCLLPNNLFLENPFHSKNHHDHHLLNLLINQSSSSSSSNYPHHHQQHFNTTHHLLSSTKEPGTSPLLNESTPATNIDNLLQLTEAINPQPLPHQPHSTPWQSIPSTDQPSQNIRQLTEDAIYVASGTTPNHCTSTSTNTSLDWPNNHWPLKEPSIISESPQSANHPSSPYSAWPPLPQDDSLLMSSSNNYNTTTNPPDPFAAQLWHLYGPPDEKTPTSDALETLVRRLTELGLDVNQIRETLNSRDWKDGLNFTNSVCCPSSNNNHSNSSSPREFPQNSREPAQGAPTDKPSRTSMRATPQPVRFSKTAENLTGNNPFFIREPSLERGRRIDVARRTTCNLAGRWQECTNLNRSPAVSDMDWKAQSRSRSRTQADWAQQGFRPRSRLQEFRPDRLSAAGHEFEGGEDSSQPFKTAISSTPGPFEPPSNGSFPRLGSHQQTAGTSDAATTEISNNNHQDYHHGIIQQLIGSYHAQQSEEIGLQSLTTDKHADDLLNFEPYSAPLVSSSYGFSSSIPLGEFEIGSWHPPLKPSQHSLLGSIPGLTQDFADLANAHSEYGYIPRLVRKTSFDEILAQQHHPKRPVESGEGSPTRLDNLSCSTADSLARPNTATESREGQYRMGLDASIFEKQSQISTPSGTTATTSQPDYFDLLSSTVSQSDSSNESEFKNQYQSSRLRSHSNSSENILSLGVDEGFVRLFGEAESGGSVVDRITPYDILTEFERFDSTPVAHNNTRHQWLQGSVAPAAVQPSSVVGESTTKPLDVNHSRLVSSPSSSSSSSEASSSRAGLPLQINTSSTVPQTQLANERSTTDSEPPTKISFSGGRCSHSSSIGEARKRTKQLPYSSSSSSLVGIAAAADPTNNKISSSSNGQATNSSHNNHSNVTQCLNCHTTETPLWRRDSEGRPLCNACGLFVNLHGTPRPAALSTGIIKRRNRGKNRDKTGSSATSSNSNNNKTTSFSPTVKQVLCLPPHRQLHLTNQDKDTQPAPATNHHNQGGSSSSTSRYLAPQTTSSSEPSSL
ncbi:hypothetical protein VP01_780g4 [Puccinia sorghi]|uniref:GATA-type domain-containing protein n=1 Tax=Puccinia sorghi TaxID=27349 RepID=A0A0L6UB53_9BASI|nr:hypothetical protein VP01_780g4 [Puccinia sorghi]